LRPLAAVRCPAGQSAYHGRGPIQLSWNFNYKAAGDALGIDLLNNPDRVKNEATIVYQTAVWYWITQNGPNTMSAHAAITGGFGFGGTIRSINGALECDGRNPATVANRSPRTSGSRRFSAWTRAATCTAESHRMAGVRSSGRTLLSSENQSASCGRDGTPTTAGAAPREGSCCGTAYVGTSIDSTAGATVGRSLSWISRAARASEPVSPSRKPSR
jgi:hypothetical protein